jgi:hypothetical protein
MEPEKKDHRHAYRSFLTIGLIFSLFGMAQAVFLFFGVAFLAIGAGGLYCAARE